MPIVTQLSQSSDDEEEDQHIDVTQHTAAAASSATEASSTHKHASSNTTKQTTVASSLPPGHRKPLVQTVTSWALTLMMHQLLHWPEQYDESLWPFAMQQAVTLWNYLPKSSTRLSPIEIFTGTTVPDHNLLLRSRVWGCPVYVLDPCLQDGKNLPKWHKHSRQGMYLGVSSQHSSTVGLITSNTT